MTTSSSHRERPPLAPVAILFDLDGTLVDTMQEFADVAADVMVRHHGLDRVVARRRYLETSGIPFFQQLEVIAPNDEHNKAAAADFEREKLIATKDVQPDADAVRALEQLKERGYGLAICSNNFQGQVDEFVAQCKAPLDLALGFGDDICKGQPHFEAAGRAFSCKPSELLFVGDSIKDAELAQQSGLPFVARLGTFTRDDFVRYDADGQHINDISELLALVK